MWDALWLNAHLATMQLAQPYGQIRDGAIAIKNRRIAWVGARADLPNAPEACAQQIFDAQGQWITPGLIDCHTHLVYAGDRVQDFEKRLQENSRQDAAHSREIFSTVSATRQASESELIAAATRRLNKFQQEGVTTLEIKSGYGLDLDTELKLLKIARGLTQVCPVTIYTTFLGAHALPPEFKDRADDYIDFVCTKVLPIIALQGLAHAVDASCEKVAFSSAQIRRFLQTAARLQLPVKLHTDQTSNVGGATLAAEFKALSANHLNYSSIDGIRAMAAAKTVAVLLPGTFYFLRETQLPPVEAFRQHRVPIAIATDSNAETSPTTSLLLMLNMACILFRLTPEEALAGVTRNAALALGCQKEYGTLAVGKMADFVFWDIQHPAELAYALGSNPCVAVIKHGRLTKGGRR